MKRTLYTLLALLLVSVGLTQPSRLSLGQLSTTGATAGKAVTYSGSAVVWGNPTPAAHDAALITSGTVAPARLGSGNPTVSTCLLGNSTWGSCGAGGSGAAVTSSVAPLKAASVALIGASAEAARADHVHPLETLLPAATISTPGTFAQDASKTLQLINGAGGNITVLLDPAPTAYRRYVFVRGESSANTVTLDANGALFEDLSTTMTLPGASSTELTFDGSIWLRVSRPAAGGSVNLAANYAWTGTHTFSQGPVVSGTALQTNALDLGIQSVVTSGGTTTLTSTSPHTTLFTGTAAQTVVLPAATTLSTGHRYKFTNQSTQPLTVQTSGGAVLWVVAGGSSTDLDLALITNGTAAGTWNLDYRAGASASGKVSTFSNSLNFAGTDGATLNVGAGGTLTRAAVTPTQARTAATAAINTTATYITPTTFTIPANTLAVGDSFRITISGTNTSTAAVANTFTPRLGSAGTTADTALTPLASTSATSGTNFPFMVEFFITVRAIGASGSVYSQGRLTNGGTVGISTSFVSIPAGGATTINTTGALVLGASLVTGATTSTTTIQSATVERL